MRFYRLSLRIQLLEMVVAELLHKSIPTSPSNDGPSLQEWQTQVRAWFDRQTFPEHPPAVSELLAAEQRENAEKFLARLKR